MLASPLGDAFFSAGRFHRDDYTRRVVLPRPNSRSIVPVSNRAQRNTCACRCIWRNASVSGRRSAFMAAVISNRTINYEARAAAGASRAYLPTSRPVLHCDRRQCVGVSPVAAYRVDREPLIRLLLNPVSVLLSGRSSAAGEILVLLSLPFSFFLSRVANLPLRLS